MATGSLAGDFDVLARSGTVAGLTDGELLRRFRTRRDGATAELAFGAIVARHGPMVLGVLRHVLREPSDVDDAFQATFLVLVRKAGSVRAEDSLAPWLYGVAFRVARKSRALAWKRAKRESPGVDVDPIGANPVDDTFDLRPVLYEELNRLPEKYRTPVVLCHLEGLTHEEAARQLGWPVGTVSGRLSRARETLRSRLARRGLGVPAAAVLAMLNPKTASAVSPSLLRLTVRAAATFAASGSVSATVLTLTRGVLANMFMTKLKTVLLAASAVGLTTAGAGYVVVKGQEPATAEARNEARPPEPPQTKPGPDTPVPIAAAPAGLPGDADPFAPGQPPAATVPAGLPGFPKSAEAFRQADFRRNQIGAFRTGSIIAIPAPDGRSINAKGLGFARGTPDWVSYEAPEGVTKIMPVMNSDVLALAMTGPSVKQLAVFSLQANKGWVTQPLREPTDEVVPIVGAKAVYYRVGLDVYAFSVLKAKWGVLHLTGPEDPRILLEEKAILVQQGETLYVFDNEAGAWSKGVPIMGAEPKPAVTRPDPGAGR